MIPFTKIMLFWLIQVGSGIPGFPLGVVVLNFVLVMLLSYFLKVMSALQEILYTDFYPFPD